MANIKDNKKGFKVIQISRKELVEELGQYGAMGICDYCNETASTGCCLRKLLQRTIRRRKERLSISNP